MSEISRVSRDKLSKVFDGNLEMIKAFENLTDSVKEGIPDALIIAQSTADQALSLAQAQAFGLFSHRAAPSNDVRPGSGVLVDRDAAGAVVSIDLAYVLLAVRAFLPGPQPAPPGPDDASSVIASRVFRK